MDYFNYSRRQANEVYVGATPMGGANPIRIQSMTNTVTMDTEACIEQAKRIIDAGGEYVRLTTQGVREAENLKYINVGLRSQVTILFGSRCTFQSQCGRCSCPLC